MKTYALLFIIYLWGIFHVTAQNIGIGTNAPSTTLDVNGQIRIRGGSPAVNKVLMSDINGLASWALPPTELPAGSNTNTLRYNGTNWVASSNLSNTGTNIGIGLAGAAPGYLLDVGGRMRIRHNTFTAGLWLNNAANTAEAAFIGMVNDTTVGFWGNNQYRMSVDVKNGYMDIGPNTLGNKISIWKNANQTQYGIGLKSGLMQLYTDGSTSDIAFGYGNSNSFTERMRIKGNGNVGIGTSSPVFKLDVLGDARIWTDATVLGSMAISGETDISNVIRIGGGSPAAGKVLTSTDASGNAVWKVKSGYGFHVRTNASYNNSDLNSPLRFNVIQHNDGNNYNATTGIYTVPEAGFYHFDASVDASSNGCDCPYTSIFLYKNTEALALAGTGDLVMTRPNLNISISLYCNANDQIYLKFNSPLAVTGSSWSFFSGYKVY